jgi:undecaprenyl-diphosphatase
VTFLLSGFGLLGRFAGDLLTSALGWASSLLFGRVPRSHQIYLVLMMAGSFWWLLVVLGLLIPGIASGILAATPHPPFVDQVWLATFLLATLILLPPAVGLAGYFVPSQEERPGGVAVLIESLRGYLLVPVIAGILIFLSGVGIVRKVRSARHGWKDVHVPIVTKAGGYDDLVLTLGEALASAGMPTTAADAPWVLTLPARILTAVAGGNVRKLRPDRLVELRGDDLRVGVYPSDIAISSTSRGRIRARIAVLSRLSATSSRLTTSAEAQEVEDLVKQLATTAATPDGVGLREARGALLEIDTRLLALEVPTEEWDLLYGLRLGLDRDVLAGSPPGTVFPGSVQSAANTAETPATAAGNAATTGEDGEPPPRPAVQSPVQPPSRRGGLDLRWLATASLLAFIALTIAVGARVVFPFDAPLLAAALTLNGVPAFWEFMSQTANFPLIAIAIALVLWLIRQKRYREALLVFLMLAAVTAGSEGVKQLTARDRPSGGGDGIPGVVYSYPSGHVLEAMTILGMLVVRAWRSARRLLLRVAFAVLVAIEVILVGIGRLAMDAHFPTDLLAGFLGSLTALCWYAWLTRPAGWADTPTAAVARSRPATTTTPGPAKPRPTSAPA